MVEMCLISDFIALCIHFSGVIWMDNKLKADINTSLYKIYAFQLNIKELDYSIEE